MQKKYSTNNSKQTKKLGEILAKELKGGEIICLIGELGSGKTTFTQGLLEGLKVKGPYTSPTFLIMKEYNFNKVKNQKPKAKTANQNLKIEKIYHFDAYRVGKQDILNLGWEEIIANPKNIVIIEWADRIKEIIPAEAIWIEFSWLEERERSITLNSKIKI